MVEVKDNRENHNNFEKKDVITITPTRLLGLSSKVTGNGAFYNESFILYACENSIVKYNLKKKIGHVEINTMLKQQCIEAFVINPQRNLLIFPAVGSLWRTFMPSVNFLRPVVLPQYSVTDRLTPTLISVGVSGRDTPIFLYKKKCSPNKKETFVNDSIIRLTRSSGDLYGHVEHLDFSASSTLLGAIISPPHRLCVFSLEQAVMVLNLRFTQLHGRLNKKLYQVLFNPVNDKVLLLVGDSIFRIIRMKITVKKYSWDVKFKTMGFYQAKHLPVTVASWVDQDRILAGTADGRLIIVENCEIKGIYMINNLNRLFITVLPPHLKVRERIRWIKVAQMKAPDKYSDTHSITHIVGFEKGFVIASDKLRIFKEPPDRPRWFFLSKVIEVDSDSTALLNMQSHWSGKLLTCSTQSKNIFFVDLNKPSDSMSSEILENISAGDGRVQCISTCLWRPLCLSLSGRSVCLWNYNTAEVVNRWTFPCLARTVSLHPRGSRFCLSLENHLCLFDIMHNYQYSHRYRSSELALLVYYSEIFTHCTFSGGGAYFGGATCKKIYVFSSTTFQIVNVFIPQALLTRSIIDDRDDTITSTNPDGLVVRYNLQTGKIFWKSVNEGSSYNEFVEDKDRNKMIITGNGTSITVVSTHTPVKISSIAIDSRNIQSVSVSPASRVAYFGTKDGSLVQAQLSGIYKAAGEDLPKKRYVEYFTQGHGISQIIITPTNKLITGNTDGCLSVFDIDGPKNTDYECPHERTDLLQGSLSILKFITSVRKCNEDTLKDWYEIKEFMVNCKFSTWSEQNYEMITSQMKEIEEKLNKIQKVRDYYNRAWVKMDSFWEPQEKKFLDIKNNYIYYNEQFKNRENVKFDQWARGLWHIQHIDTASEALCRVLDETLEDVFNKKTIQERYIDSFKALQEEQIKLFDEARRKVDKAASVYRKLYSIARNTWNGLQNLIMQEGPPEKSALNFHKTILNKQYLTYIETFQEDITILNKIYKKFMQELHVRRKLITDRAFVDVGPTGITMKLLPALMSSPCELKAQKERMTGALCTYLSSQEEQWKELMKWDWIFRESSAEYHKWFVIGRARYTDGFHNSHAYHELRNEELLKHLSRKQLSLIHSTSSNIVTLSRSLKVAEQFYCECVKVQNYAEGKLSKIGEDIDEISMADLHKKLMIYELNSSPKGYVLIINNVDFDSEDLDRRDGSAQDLNQLRAVFRDYGFKVRTYTNLNSNTFMKVMRDFSRLDELWKVDCAIVVIMTHGHKDKQDMRTVDLAMTNEHYISSDWVRERFTNDRCRALRNKPKIIFLQACRDESDKQVVVRRPRDNDKDPPALVTDLLIVNSCLPGYGAHRNSKSGSWFTQELIKTIRMYANVTDLYSILNKVDRKLRERFVREKATSYQAVYYENWSFNKLFFLSRRAAGAHKAAVALVALSPACRGDKILVQAKKKKTAHEGN